MAQRNEFDRRERDAVKAEYKAKEARRALDGDLAKVEEWRSRICGVQGPERVQEFDSEDRHARVSICG